MILEQEVISIENSKSINSHLRSSVLAFGFYILSIAANLPGYAFSIKQTNLMLAFSFVSIVAILVAIVLAVLNIIKIKKLSHFKG